MGFIIHKLFLRNAFRMIGGFKDATSVLTSRKLHGVTRSVGVAASILRKIISRVGFALPGAAYLGGNVHQIAPSSSAIRRSLVPHFPQPFTFSHFTFVVIAGIVKQKDQAYAPFRVTADIIDLL